MLSPNYCRASIPMTSGHDICLEVEKGVDWYAKAIYDRSCAAVNSSAEVKGMRAWGAVTCVVVLCFVSVELGFPMRVPEAPKSRQYP